MKKLILLVILLFTIIVEGQININGFGKLQLGMTIEEVLKIRDENVVFKPSYNINSNYYDYYSDDDMDHSFIFHYNKCMSNSVTIFGLSIVDGLVVNATLLFHNKKVYSIIIRSNKTFVDLITFKYGNPEYISEVKRMFKEGSWYTTNNIELYLNWGDVILTDTKLYDIVKREYYLQTEIKKEEENKRKIELMNKL